MPTPNLSVHPTLDVHITRTRKGRFCTLNLRLSAQGQLSVTGSEGPVLTRSAAKKTTPKSFTP